MHLIFQENNVIYMGLSLYKVHPCNDFITSQFSQYIFALFDCYLPLQEHFSAELGKIKHINGWDIVELSKLMTL